MTEFRIVPQGPHLNLVRVQQGDPNPPFIMPLLPNEVDVLFEAVKQYKEAQQ